MTRSARWVRTACAGVLCAIAAPWSMAGAQFSTDSWQPSAMFLQAGIGREVTSAGAGASWDWDWHYDAPHARITGSTEVLIADWRARDPGNHFTQVGVTPVLRLYPNDWGRSWFIEGGIGANAISPHYQNRGKRFSTVYNFGDHLGVGRRFGHAMEHEVVLRVQHFSNCGVRHPNPGENFVQLRYVRRF